MKRTRYLSINVKLGLAGSFPINDDRVQFHEDAIRLIYGRDLALARLGLKHTSAFDYTRIDSNTAFMSDLIDYAIEEVLPSGTGKFDLLLVDFTNNPFGLLREPILMQLAEVFDKKYSSGVCRRFLLLLPDLPAEEAPSMQQFMRTAAKSRSYKLVIVARDGANYYFPRKGPRKGWNTAALKDRYIKIIERLEEDASTRFENKIVKRLGHFKRARHTGGCRSYSYTADNCDGELQELIEDWWRKLPSKPTAIVYDSRTNPSLSIAIKAFSESKSLPFYRVEDVLAYPTRAAEAAQHDNRLLILDVVETGNTLIDHTTKLSQIGVHVNKEILTAISKGGSKETRIGDFILTSFSSREREPESTRCIQCELRLPFTSDDQESFFKLRAFDMWKMASVVGWEPEPDVPENIGEGYDIVPRFTQMLREYGDWIAYKMEKRYQGLLYPDNIFVIHPDELGANAVSEKLQLRFKNKLSVVRVPRDAIKAAQASSNSWEKVLKQLGGNKTWVKQLESLRNASALITDIFNGSGSTFQSLHKLLNLHQIDVFCYFPVVDRDCGAESADKYMTPKYSLYDWYDPRSLVIKERR